MSAPSFYIQQLFLAPSVQYTRRVEIYEEDGTTPFDLNAAVVGGSVSVDSSRDERRIIDLTLNNDEGQYRHDPTGLWYDKVIKTFYGIEWLETNEIPVTTSRLNYGGTATVGMAPGVTGAATLSTISPSVRRMTWTTATTVPSGGIEWGAFNLVKIPVVAGEVYSYSSKARANINVRLFVKLSFYNAANGLVTTVSGNSDNITAGGSIFQSVPKVENVTTPAGATHVLVGTYSTIGSGSSVWHIGDWLEVPQPFVVKGATAGNSWDGNTNGAYPASYSWLGEANDSVSQETTILSYNKVVTTENWETQTGEFIIDSLTSQHWPHNISIQGRDYTAKLMSSQFKVDTAFTALDQLESVIRAIATAGKIDPLKMVLPTTGQALGKSFYFERGTTRWEAMKQVASAFSYELYFDAKGYLIMRTYRDPVSSPLAFSFRTGPGIGSVISWSKATTRTQMYNVVIVTGESTDTAPVYAIAENHSPTSPTSIENLKQESVLVYSSSFITTVQQAQALANSWLAIYSLEEYDLTLETLMLPWLEASDIVEFIPEGAINTDPTKFLWSNFTMPLDLAPMTGTGKRVTIVG